MCVFGRSRFQRERLPTRIRHAGGSLSVRAQGRENACNPIAGGAQLARSDRPAARSVIGTDKPVRRVRSGSNRRTACSASCARRVRSALMTGSAFCDRRGKAVCAASEAVLMDEDVFCDRRVRRVRSVLMTSGAFCEEDVLPCQERSDRSVMRSVEEGRFAPEAVGGWGGEARA